MCSKRHTVHTPQQYKLYNNNIALEQQIDVKLQMHTSSVSRQAHKSSQEITQCYK